MKVEKITFRGERLAQTRESAGINRNELARRLKIGRSHVTDLERGRRKPSADLLLRLMEVLKASPKNFY